MPSRPAPTGPDDSTPPVYDLVPAPGNSADGGREPAEVVSLLKAILNILGARRPVPRLALRLDDAARAVGLSRRALERLRAAGKFPSPDKYLGKCPVWSPETIRKWIEAGGR
jgi:predicted DNA-binding transcriptional regulator AlpA